MTLASKIACAKSPLLAFCAVSLASFTSLVVAPRPVHAAGYYVGEIGPRSVGRAGAVMVNPGDPTALWLNPAAITNVTGLQLHIDGALIFMDASFTRDCGPGNNCGPKPVLRNYGKDRTFQVPAGTEGRAPSDANISDPVVGGLGNFGTPSDFSDGHTVRNQAPFQAIPGLWAVLNLDSFGLDGLAAGAGFYAPYASDYQFGADEYTRYSLIDRDLMEVYYQATLAYRFRNWIAVGASLQGISAGVRQKVKLSADQYGNENPDWDLLVEVDTLQHLIPSANVGVWSNPLPGLELGASLQLGREVRATGPVRILERGTEIQRYLDSGLVTLHEDSPTATASFRMPALWRAGVKYGQHDVADGLFDFDVELDFVYEGWSAYDHVLLETEGVAFSFLGGEPQPLAPVVQARDWQDTWSLRFGGDVSFFDDMLALRTGAFYETGAIPSSTLSVELFDGDKVGVGVGASFQLFGVSLDVGYGHHFVFDRTVGDESIIHLENTAPPVQNPEPRTRIAMGKYLVSYDVVSIGLNVAFDEMLGFGVHAKAATGNEEAPSSTEPPAMDEAPAAEEVAPAAAEG